ncbi:hypothetical protein [uncultured Porphyromonas sp.]|uniref:hypothetical protein n=1 Tax=uncultured Porphyromonas sp. TaxID=159274 RepID=UPI002609948F|nr:hypothetical protein [uncultured Porphyromonas sp.]
MRLKTMLLGMLVAPISLLLLSGRESSRDADKGFNPGEQIPSMMVDGCDLAETLANEPKAVLVIWSVDDATSRVANAWACNSANLRATDTPVYSICLDGDETTATLYAKMDGAKENVAPIGLEGEKLRGGTSQLVSRGSGKVYYISYGIVERVMSAETLFNKIR